MVLPAVILMARRHKFSSVSAATLRENAAGLGELGCGYVEQRGAGHQSQQWQVLIQLVQSGDGDDAVGVEQPVAEQDHETLLLNNQVLKRLVKVEYRSDQQGISITHIYRALIPKQSELFGNEQKCVLLLHMVEGELFLSSSGEPLPILSLSFMSFTTAGPVYGRIF